MLREKLLGEPAYLNVVAAQTGKVFHKHGGGLASGKLLHHIVEAGAVHRNAGNAIVQEVDQVGITFFLCNLGQQFLLESNLSRVFFPQEFHYVSKYIKEPLKQFYRHQSISFQKPISGLSYVPTITPRSKNAFLSSQHVSGNKPHA